MPNASREFLLFPKGRKKYIFKKNKGRKNYIKKFRIVIFFKKYRIVSTQERACMPATVAACMDKVPAS